MFGDHLALVTLGADGAEAVGCRSGRGLLLFFDDYTGIAAVAKLTLGGVTTLAGFAERDLRVSAKGEGKFMRQSREPFGCTNKYRPKPSDFLTGLGADLMRRMAASERGMIAPAWLIPSLGTSHRYHVRYHESGAGGGERRRNVTKHQGSALSNIHKELFACPE
jgi:hypothetical protein